MTLPKARSMFDNTKFISSKQTPRNPMPSYFTLCTKVDICNHLIRIDQVKNKSTL